MHTLLLVAVLAASPRPEAEPRTTPLQAAAQCVRRYLGDVRIAAPSPPASRPPAVLVVSEDDYRAAKRWVAPRTLEEVARSAARGEPHGMAPWTFASRDRFLETFELLGARRAPRGAVVVTVRERFYVVREGGERLEPVVSAYLVARVDGAWKVVDRREGTSFADGEVEHGYPGYWD